MKKIAALSLSLFVAGCSTLETVDAPATSSPAVASALECPGTTELPAQFKEFFEAVEDPELLNKALGEPDKGGLCKGQVYVSKVELPVNFFRAWNSTNPYSEFGRWWAFGIPEGSTSQYREDYEICFQWSPLDRLVSCPLKANQKIVVGPGQSAVCSEYLSYPASSALQIYIDNANDAFEKDECLKAVDEFNWKEI
ncbi:hypothetical protein [Sessilibacter corallicola]|uniref:Lipoprotein n=1 Tax=Sessilibacter corallicola TaxID=2904075 RepID=A0ABQ0AB48_9GAMM